MSKLIANQLKPHPQSRTVSQNRTVFQEGKWINENVILAQKIMHTMNKTRSKTRMDGSGAKIDSFLIKLNAPLS